MKLFDAKDVKLSARRKEEIEALMQRGWIQVHAYMSQLDSGPQALDTLLYMLHTELKNLRRPYVLHRVHRCYNHARLQLEERELFSVA
jgi:hypothetical protein